MAPLEHLFRPLALGERTAENRIVSTAHATGFAPGGIINDRLIGYHERKAAGGAGVVMTFGSASVSPRSSASFGSISLWDPANEPALRELAERVHRHRSLLFSQASHLGRRGTSLHSGFALAAPSAIPEPVHREIPHALEAAEIRAIIADFASAAVRLERCGWDGIEITSFGGHLLEQFWSPVVNRRSDDYGGDLAGRMRFSVEVVDAVAEAVSSDFLVGFRLTGDPLTDQIGLSAADMREIARRLDSLGRIDVFNVSGGSGATPAAQAATVPPDSFPVGCFNHLARGIREVVGAPVIAAGRNLDVADAERALAAGDCDLVAMTRAIIADPDLPRRARDGELARIRPCIAINESCIGRLYTGLPIACAVNPGIVDDELADRPGGAPSTPRRVVVVGGGPAGMEAARVAAEAGHGVVLLERAAGLGGQVRIAALAPDRPHLADHVDWQERELARLAVEVRRGVEAGTESVLALEPDEVIVAAGSRSVVPEQADRGSIARTTDVELLRGLVGEPGDRVVVVDREGQIRGASAALVAARRGAGEVTIVTPLPSVCAELDPTQVPGIRSALGRYGVICRADLELVEETGNGGLLFREVWSGEATVTADVDLAIFVGYREVRDELADALRSESPRLKVTLVGDCLAPRRLADAVADGARAGAAVGAVDEADRRGGAATHMATRQESTSFASAARAAPPR